MADPLGRNRTSFTPLARATFLEELAVLGTVNAAAAAAGVHSRIFYYHREHDPSFADEWDEALQRHDRLLMQQVRRMALDGIVTKTIRDADGNVQYEERKYSERLLLRYLERMERGSWQPSAAVETTGKVQHEHSGRIEVENLTPDQRRKARDFLASLN
jgi:hypothetical protein